ncbi:Flp family type IVb pilin [Vibrio porteresiae]|uniref:Flp family type IVb pilin n=1 Tax=Vibrio porteresiae DSM 19223 TaxID=1123496 RepID=A0ABZ0QM32_9VIBR|nr:Flp family type IVb pilin [Vibrio porteresiae]WPC76471.1 Flp family type IVb pilin [Vibrio porteresiae DSM 19223]
MLNTLITKVYATVVSFVQDQRGVTAIEYAIIGVAMSAIVLAVFNSGLSDSLNSAVTTISSNITTAGGTSASGASGN